MKLAFSLLMCLAAAATLQPAQAATQVATYEQAQAKVNDEGYLLFIYGQGWDKRSKELITALYNAPAVIKAAGKSVMMLVPLPDSMDDAEKEAFNKVMGKLQLPHVHSKHSFPAVVMYDKTGRQYSIICGPAMVQPDPERIAFTITRRKAKLVEQLGIMAQADKAQGEERARLLLQACRVDNLERPDRVQDLIRQADPDDKAGCLAALNFYNNPLGDKVKDMPLADVLVEMDKAIANPLHTVQQKQNACAFTIGTIRRRAGAGGSDLIRKYAELMKSLDPDSVLGRSADVVLRDWALGLQYVRGWSTETLPIANMPTELQGRLPIAAAGTYKLHFKPTGGNKAIITRVALYDGDTLLSEDVRTTEIADNGQDHFYTMTAPAEVKKPRVLITFGNEENNRNTRGQFNITKD